MTATNDIDSIEPLWPGRDFFWLPLVREFKDCAALPTLRFVRDWSGVFGGVSARSRRHPAGLLQMMSRAQGAFVSTRL